MKNSLIIFGLLALLVLKVSLTSTKEVYSEYKEKEEAAGLKQYWNQRIGTFKSVDDYLSKVKKSRKQIAKTPKRKTLGLDWKELGPDNIGGRNRSILIDSKNNNLMYAGGVAGGLWYSVDAGLSWQKTTPGDNAEVLTVTCITQDAEGYIYYGTGESILYQEPSRFVPFAAGFGYRGQGIFRSIEPHGTDFKQLTNSWVGFENITLAVNSIASEGTAIYAGAYNGLVKSTDRGENWEIVSSLTDGTPITGTVSDVKVLSSGKVILAMGIDYYSSPNGEINSFTKISGVGEILTPAQGRSVIAVAPSDENVIYISRADDDEQFDGLFRSKDAGVTWEKLFSGGSSIFKPFNGQGDFNQCLAVFPNNPNKILLGGLDLYEWEEGENWVKKSKWNAGWGDKNYIHADHHSIVFHPSKSNQYYVGTDGGIFFTNDNGDVYQRLNRGFNITQFYGLAFGGDGVVLGGTQDNSNIYIDYSGTTEQSGDLHSSGDGGHAAISHLLPDVFFIESQYGNIKRDNSRSDGYTECFSHPDSWLTLGIVDYNYAWSEFVTPITLWESAGDTLVPDSVKFFADRDYLKDEQVLFSSNITGLNFYDSIPYDLKEDDSIMVKVPKQSMLLYGTHEALYMSRNAIDFSTNVEWIKLSTEGCQIASLPLGITAIATSKDGDHVFYGTNRGKLYRVSNVSKVLSDSDVSNATVTLIGEFYQTDLGLPTVITDIAVDPNDPEHVIATVGYYDQTTNIYKTNTGISASDASGFASIDGNLPQIPVYSAMIEVNSGAYIIGTEYGLFSSTDGGVNWTQEVSGPPQGPVTMIRQETFEWVPNYGQIYVATHGRGMFTSDHYVTSVSEEPKAINRLNVEVYPNPAINSIQFNIDNPNDQDLLIQVIDLKGQLVQTETKKDQQLNIASLSSGTYILSIQKGREIYSSTFIKK